MPTYLLKKEYADLRVLFLIKIQIKPYINVWKTKF